MRRLGLAAAAVAATAATELPAVAGTKTIVLKDDKISPSSLTVRKGAKVKVRWAGKHPHNLVGGGIHTATKTSGSTTVTFKRKGRFTLVCQLHAGMRLSLKVT